MSGSLGRALQEILALLTHTAVHKQHSERLMVMALLSPRRQESLTKPGFLTCPEHSSTLWGPSTSHMSTHAPHIHHHTTHIITIIHSVHINTHTLTYPMYTVTSYAHIHIYKHTTYTPHIHIQTHPTHYICILCIYKHTHHTDTCTQNTYTTYIPYSYTQI